MAIYNREDYKTALPQLEKSLNNRIDDTNSILDTLLSVNKDGSLKFNIEQITPTFHNCSTGSYTCCYKIGNIVFLAFNINITTASNSNYDFLKGIPPAIHSWAVSATPTGSVNTARWWVTGNGTLCSDGATVTGWQNGSVVYICKE